MYICIIIHILCIIIHKYVKNEFYILLPMNNENYPTFCEFADFSEIDTIDFYHNIATTDLNEVSGSSLSCDIMYPAYPVIAEGLTLTENYNDNFDFTLSGPINKHIVSNFIVKGASDKSIFIHHNTNKTNIFAGITFVRARSVCDKWVVLKVSDMHVLNLSGKFRTKINAKAPSDGFRSSQCDHYDQIIMVVDIFTPSQFFSGTEQLARITTNTFSIYSKH